MLFRYTLFPILLLVILLSSIPLFSQWEELHFNVANSSEGDLEAVHFLNDSLGWTGSSYEWAYRTSDTGKTWKDTNLGLAVIYDIHFLDDTYGWISGTDTRMYYSDDGGNTWKERYISNGPFTGHDAVQTLDPTTAVMAGGTGYIVKTTDAGMNWDQKNSGVSVRLNDLHFPDPSIGWIVGHDGTVLFSSDGGDNWSSRSVNTSKNLRGVFFFDQDTGWVVGDSGKVFLTADGGNTWEEKNSGTGKQLHDVQFLHPSKGFIVGNDRTILYSQDSGDTWVSQVSGDHHEDLFSLSIVNDSAGWAVGEDTTIYRMGGLNGLDTTQDTTQHIAHRTPEDPSMISLDPNPTDGRFKIRSQKEKGPFEGSLIVMDMNGRTVLREKVQGEHPYEKWFRLPEAASGVHIVKWQEASGTYVRRLVVE